MFQKDSPTQRLGSGCITEHTACMFQWLWSFVDWLKGLFYNEEMEVTLVGLQNSGKTTLVNVLAVPVGLACFGC